MCCLHHADPTPTSRGHQSDHLSMSMHHTHRRSCNTGWSHKFRDLLPQKRLSRTSASIHKDQLGSFGVLNSRARMSTILWFNVAVIRRNIYVHYKQAGLF